MPFIYGIKNNVTDKIYVGKTRNFAKRITRHRYLLKYNKHFNKHLQNSYNKHGVDAFEFIKLEECSVEDLTELEQKWINTNENKLFNHKKDVTKLSGPANPFFGHKHSKSTKNKMSLAKINKYLGVSNPNYGRKQSPETLKKMILNNSSTKLSIEKVLAIVRMLKSNKNHEEIAQQFGVSRTLITRIANGDRWNLITKIKEKVK